MLVLFATLGMMVMISANHFLTLYLGLELLSLSLYAMVALQRDSAHATEAAMKYFVLGALASGMLLYGMSMIYGATGIARASRDSGRSDRRAAAPTRDPAGVRPGVRRRRPRLQAGRGAVPHVGAGRLPGRAHRGDAVHRLGAEARRVRLRHAPAGRGAGRRCCWSTGSGC